MSRFSLSMMPVFDVVKKKRAGVIALVDDSYVSPCTNRLSSNFLLGGFYMTYRNLFLSTALAAFFSLAAIAADFNGPWTAAIETQLGVQNYNLHI